MAKEQKVQLVKIAKNLIGKPYKYGATLEEAPNFFDCSSFTQYVFKQVGVQLPRSTIEQAREGKRIENIETLEPGDLIFFRGAQGHYNEKFPKGVGHVVLYIGDNKTIHAASRRVQEKPQIVEIGQVEGKPLEEIVEKLKPITVIKRIIQ